MLDIEGRVSVFGTFKSKLMRGGLSIDPLGICSENFWPQMAVIGQNFLTKFWVDSNHFQAGLNLSKYSINL